MELSRQKSTRFVGEFAFLKYRDVRSCRGRRSSAGRRTKGCPLRASKRFVGEFAHASHTGIPCPARLTYRDFMPVPGMEQKVAL